MTLMEVQWHAAGSRDIVTGDTSVWGKCKSTAIIVTKEMWVTNAGY